MLHSVKRRWAVPAVTAALLATPAAAAVARDFAGTAGPDHLRGTPGADIVSAGAGNDHVRTFAADDTGGDTVYGDEGDDRIFVRDGEQHVVDCGPGFDRVRADFKDVVNANCERVARGVPRPKDAAPEDGAPGAS